MNDKPDHAIDTHDRNPREPGGEHASDIPDDPTLLIAAALIFSLLLSSCAQAQGFQEAGTTPDHQVADKLDATIEQIDTERKEVCAREEYRPLFLHTACTVSDITSEQLADKSNLAETYKPMFWKIHVEDHLMMIQLVSALRSYGGSQGADAASAVERAEGLFEKNALALYEGTMNWGDYNKRRKEITDILLDEFNEIDPPPNDSPRPEIILPA